MAASTSGTTCPVTVRYTTLWGTTALNVRVPEAIRDAVRREAATNPATPSQAAVIEALVRAHLMH